MVNGGIGMDFDGRDEVVTINQIEYEISQRPKMDADGEVILPTSRRYETWAWRYQWEGRQDFIDIDDTFRARQLRAAGLPHDQPTWQEGFIKPLESSLTEEDIRIYALQQFDENVKRNRSKFSKLPRLRRTKQHGNNI